MSSDRKINRSIGIGSSSRGMHCRYPPSHSETRRADEDVAYDIAQRREALARERPEYESRQAREARQKRRYSK